MRDTHGWPRRPQPEWWPEGESWPPVGRHGRPSWTHMRRRIIRVVIIAALVLLVIPIAVAIGLAATLGGSTAVLIVLICWLGLLLTAMIAGSFLARAFGPVRELIVTTEQLADGDYSARADLNGSTALQPLARSVNTMAERLETSDRLRQRLLADVGHELRTPLTVIRGSVEAMADGVRPVDRDQLRLLLGDVSVMERLLADLQTLSAAEAGRLRLHMEPVDLPGLVADVAAGFGMQARPDTEIVVEPPTQGIAPVEPIEADEVRVREVLSNLVTNALRATAGGGSIRLSVAFEPDEAGGQGSVARITVSDDGVGMTEPELRHAFDRFHKGSDSDGSGLGLAISRDLVTAHGGSISIDSDPGIGTTVVVRLPVRSAS